ncbi:MAG: hypothetical protein Greene041662_1051 [Candidatus Peregrinibacteria bacterium Greene0416_62]|nr:MAG: hypothetical protein Greene041662_1051 [Candidatus Peregrinibacteria bacterium Greene0416_62]TSC98926.1 MAG: hypothetical protein Greene101449_776 [Candidatus Peregrinibacteria bacterium Greene1014_49]
MNPRLPTLHPTKILRALKKAGFREIRKSGSHVILVDKNKRMVVVPMHNKDVKRGLLFSIIKSAELTQKEFLDLL